MFVIGATGLLLAYKKPWGLKPPTHQVAAQKTPIGLDSIKVLAQEYVAQNLRLDPTLDRIDIRYQKGIAKVRFQKHFTEIQYNIYTGERLSVATRVSDIIERIHDGSIIDFFIQSKGDPAKLIYVTITAVGLMVLSVTGFWLWYNPRRIRRSKTS